MLHNRGCERRNAGCKTPDCVTLLQVEKLVLAEKDLAAMRADGFDLVFSPWRNSSQLLRHPQLAEPLRGRPSLADAAGAAVALLPMLLRCYLQGEVLDHDHDIAEALLAVPHNCGRLLTALSATQRPRR